MNQDSLKNFQVNFSGLGCWLTVLATMLLLGSLGLGWLVKSFVVLAGLIVIAPVIVFFGFRWWLKRNLIQDDCPVCGYEFTGLNRTQFQCPSCREPLKIEQNHFERLTPPGTIDVKAVEVSAQQLED